MGHLNLGSLVQLHPILKSGALPPTHLLDLWIGIYWKGKCISTTTPKRMCISTFNWDAPCCGVLQVGGPQEKMSFFQIASGPILSIPIHSNTCQYDPCKVLLKKMTPSLPMNPPKSAFFGSSDWASDWLVTDPVLALVPRKYLYWRLPTPIDCIPHSYWLYTKCFSTLRCCGWAYGYTLMP
jgi:hypothetical protein